MGTQKVPRHGLLIGSWQTRIRTPWPSRFTWRLWSRTHARTCRLMCQEALSQTSSNTGTPLRASLPQDQPRKSVVRALTGRPSTKRSQP
jgi:hypothetical protein